MSLEDRSKEGNLLLLCPDCHRMIDDSVAGGLYTQEFLEAKKTEHESRVATATNFEVLRRTLVLTTKSRIRGTNMAVSEREISEAMLASGFVVHVNDGRPANITITLEDDEMDGWAWDRGRSLISKAIERLKRESAEGKVDHASLFALAPIPLLMFLGSELDDKITVSVFDRHRGGHQNVWCWPKQDGPLPTFQVQAQDANGSDEDVLAVVSVSGTVLEKEVPSELLKLQRVTLSPSLMTPAPGVIGSEESLDSFSEAWRQLLAEIESRWPNAARLHVVAAVPASAAIRMGQFRMRGVHPNFVVYQRSEKGYVATPEIAD